MNKKMSTRCTIASFLALNMQATAFAADDLFSLPIEQLLQLKVASATLTNETMLTVPSSVAVYEAQDIRQMGLGTLDELLNFVTGVQSTSSDRNPLYKRTSFRGRSTGTGGREILILLNGQRINSEYSGNNDYTFPRIPLSIVEKIEIIKGPGSAIYGSNAFLGVINILTKTTEAPEASIAVGNMNSVEFSTSGGLEIKELHIQASVAYGETDGDNYPNILNSYNPTERTTITDPSHHTELIFNLSYHNTSLNIAYSEQEARDYYIQGHISKGFNKSKVSSLFSTLNHNFVWSDKFNSDLWVDYRRTRTNLFIQGTPEFAFYEVTSPATTEALLADTPFYEDTHGLRLNNFYQVNDKLDLSLGFEYRHAKLQKNRSKTNLDYELCLNTQACLAYLASNGAIKPQENPNIPYFNGQLIENAEFVQHSDRNIYGTFLQSQIELTQSTELTLAVRYDDYSDIGQKVSPRISLVTKLDEKNTLKANYGEAYRAPQFSELNLINNPLIRGNPDLEPETIRSLDMIWLSQHNYWNISATYFIHKIENAIFDLVRDGLVQVENNTRETQSTHGLEVELTYAPSNQFHVRFGGTHFFKLAEDQFKESRNLAYVIANYHFEKWNYNLSANYQSNKQNIAYGGLYSDRVELDDFILVNTKISYELSPNVNLFAQAKNIFDEKYTTPSVSNRTEFGVPNRGRQWFVGSEFYF
ncbi:TonB-dependent receptor [Catenovulum sp. 2E275]|uniref:TonB-dependent receptor plug domain-containing protein n=1 Tax=Catenovulum sp. 2E275 TaxID=2980497 RepID=UPI0021CFB6DD|nr:TonB-dependent receptor [Catenovulum sp. 2E275]MCU4674285.1 TonB-dependent receptor [Catenovulum sp. 2E275]